MVSQNEKEAVKANATDGWDDEDWGSMDDIPVEEEVGLYFILCQAIFLGNLKRG